MQIQINGAPHRAPAGQGLAELITGLGLTPQTVLIEHNGQALFGPIGNTSVLLRATS